MSRYRRISLALVGFSLVLGIGGEGMTPLAGFASEEHQPTASQEQKSSPSSPAAPHTGQQAQPAVPPAVSEKGQQELEALQKKPDEFRTLVTGVQIFLGRFGYGVGPYTGILDQHTQTALEAYQKHRGLSPTGELDYSTLKSLTDDDRLMNRVVPFLPQQTFNDQKWKEWVEVQGSWMLSEGNTDEVLQTSRITCIEEFNRCIESTASLINGVVPQLDAATYVYDIKEWNEKTIVSKPYEGEACAVSILRISRDPQLVTRFVSLQESPGPCSQVKPEDRKYVLEDGAKIYHMLRMQKAEAIQKILQVTKANESETPK